MKNWQKLAVGVGIIGIGYNFLIRYDSLLNYQLIAIGVGLYFIFRNFRN